MITPPLMPTPKSGVAPFVSPVRIMEALYDDNDRNCLFEPPLPNDTAMEFYIKDTKIVCAVYALQYQDINHHHMAPALANGLKDMARPFETIGGRIQHMFQAGANSSASAQAINISAESITSLHQTQGARSGYRAGVMPLSELRTSNGGHGKSDSDGTVHPLTQSVMSEQSNVTTGSHTTMHDPQETDGSQTLLSTNAASSERRRSATSPPTTTSDLMQSSNQTGSSSMLGVSGGTPGNKENLQQHHSHHGDGGNMQGTHTLSLLGLHHGLGGVGSSHVAASQLQWFPFRGRLCAVTAEYRVEFAYGRGRLSSLTKVVETLKLAERLCMDWDGATGKFGAFPSWIHAAAAEDEEQERDDRVDGQREAHK